MRVILYVSCDWPKLSSWMIYEIGSIERVRQVTNRETFFAKLKMEFLLFVLEKD
ncbi:hypothetical protein MTBBW1_790050 [Desulfamplus magnetovallimortis]|uniref:Uncharacterized protein n=1 Tax=Desulfamplus magnetovallimortis TaxID=1246637 RepID=A0A1W1HJU9_9BACT|nr:hypothetical protein MTBBW1_790050 [Desulfamplus magnetovallimortis]